MPIFVRGEGCYALGRGRAVATSTRCPRSSASTPATAGPSSPRRRPRRRASSRTRRPGTPPIRARSSSPSGSLGWRPDDLNRVFFTSGGSEAVESALKLARSYHRARGEPSRVKVDRARARLPRHDVRRAERDGPAVGPDAVRAADAGRLPRPPHRPLSHRRGPRSAVGGRRHRAADPLRGRRRRSRR